MSIESARQFVAKVAKDEEFQEKLGACKSRAEQLQFAQAAGFEFTGDEIRAAQSELQDSDLDAVSGSGCCGCENDCCEVEA